MRRGTHEALKSDLYYAMSLIGTGESAKQIAERLVERLRESGLIGPEWIVTDSFGNKRAYHPARKKNAQR